MKGLRRIRPVLRSGVPPNQSQASGSIYFINSPSSDETKVPDGRGGGGAGLWNPLIRGLSHLTAARPEWRLIAPIGSDSWERVQERRRREIMDPQIAVSLPSLETPQQQKPQEATLRLSSPLDNKDTLATPSKHSTANTGGLDLHPRPRINTGREPY